MGEAGVLSIEYQELQDLSESESPTMDEVHEELRRLHGQVNSKEMGGWMDMARAQAFLWVLGYDVDTGDIVEGSVPGGTLDLSDYVEVE